MLIGYMNMNTWYFFMVNFRLNHYEMSIFNFFNSLVLILLLLSILDISLLLIYQYCYFYFLCLFYIFLIF